MNFIPTYAESPPKSTLTPDQVERKVQSEKAKSARSKKSDRKEPLSNLDWSGNGLASLDSLNLFPDLLTLNLSDNQIKTITPDVKHWYFINFDYYKKFKIGVIEFSIKLYRKNRELIFFALFANIESF